MSRHCLYCAKELPKNSTNNFCSKECWTEYKRLKAMDVGTDKQATVLLKRSELAEASEHEGMDEMGYDAGSDRDDRLMSSPDHEGPSDRSAPSSDSMFEEAPSRPAYVPPYSAPNSKRSSTENTSISDRLTNLEILLNEKLGQQAGDAKGLLDDLMRKIDDLANRQSKLEVDMEKADSFLRAVDKFEDRLRRIEREIQSLKTVDQGRPKGFFARLFS
ncbi:hypothetical protein JXA80_02720 [bacterium]|nr:hypothetical protein [candidate division CSSED10-310 bacterium]